MSVFTFIVTFVAGALIAAGLLLFFQRSRAQVASQLEQTLAERLRQSEGQLRDEFSRLRQEQGDLHQRQRGELTQSLVQLAQTLTQPVQLLTESNSQRMDALRQTVETRLKELQAENSGKLEEMRRTVDEKLHATLEQRLGESFKLVSERLEQVHKGLGEMQTLASGVGDLKRVLGNVKTRGILGESQLAALLEQVLTPEQYAANIATVPGSNERVEFAIRLPGRERDQPVWLPVDAKFPREDYERLLDAQERADGEAAQAAAQALEKRIRSEAKSISEKYLAPPHTTDFALLFVPTEGLYAEILRRAGLFEALQREHRVTLTGPTTLLAVLNSLQMGFRTLTIERRSSEVWQVLGAVKTEFGKFGEVLDKVKKKLDEASSQIDQTGVRSRAIARQLRDVQALPDAETQRLLAPDQPEDRE